MKVKFNEYYKKHIFNKFLIETLMLKLWYKLNIIN